MCADFCDTVYFHCKEASYNGSKIGKIPLLYQCLLIHAGYHICASLALRPKCMFMCTQGLTPGLILPLTGYFEPLHSCYNLLNVHYINTSKLCIIKTGMKELLGSCYKFSSPIITPVFSVSARF